MSSGGRSSTGSKGISSAGKRPMMLPLKKKTKDAEHGITDPSIRRLARRAGLRRIKADIFDYTRKSAIKILTPILADSLSLRNYNERVTITTSDVTSALKNNNHRYFGLPMKHKPRHSKRAIVDGDETSAAHSS